MTYQGYNLTRHFDESVYERADGSERRWTSSFPTEMHKTIERGTLQVVRYGKVTLRFERPISFYVTTKQNPGKRWRGGKVVHDEDSYRACCDDLGYKTDSLATAAAAKGALTRKIIGATNFEPPWADFPYERTVDCTMARTDITEMLRMAVHRVGHNASRMYWQHDEVGVGGGLIDAVWFNHSEGLRGFEIKSSRSDFASDKKWQNYVPYCNRFSFVSLPGVIKLTDIPDEIGLYEINIDNIISGLGDILTRRRFPKARAVEPKLYREMLERLVMKGETTKYKQDHYAMLLRHYAESYKMKLPLREIDA